MPIQSTGKTRILEAKKLQAPKPQAAMMTQEDLIKKIAAQQTPQPTEDVMGAYGSRAGRNMPGQTVTFGQLKPEFQQMQDVANRIGTAGEVSPLDLQGRTIPSAPEYKADGTQLHDKAEEFVMKLPTPSFNEILTSIQGVTNIVPGVRQVKNFFSGLAADKSHAELLKQADLAVQGIGQNLDIRQAEFLFNQIESKLIREGEQIQLESKYDVAALLAGKVTKLEEKQLAALQELQIRRGQAVDAISAKMLSDIQSQTQRPTSAGAESHAGLAA